MSARCTVCEAVAIKKDDGTLVIKHADDCCDDYCEGCERVGLPLNADYYCTDCEDALKRSRLSESISERPEAD